jgi:type I restriction enzyme R subunit
MKGRETRTISSTDFNSVTPDAKNKTHFVIVDAIGVCETDKTESHSLERKRSVPFDKLLLSLAYNNRDGDTLTSLAGRLARLDRELNENDRKEIEKENNGMPFKQLINNLFYAFDPDKKIEKAKEMFKVEAVSSRQKK